jgi:hypothetical protein
MWAERYDRELKDVFAVQDDVTQRIVNVLQVKFAAAGQKRGSHGGTANVEAHDCLLRGLERFWKFTPESTAEASAQLIRAVELDPGYAAGHAWLARVLVFRWIMLWDPNPETLRVLTITYAWRWIWTQKRPMRKPCCAGYGCGASKERLPSPPAGARCTSIRTMPMPIFFSLLLSPFRTW